MRGEEGVRSVYHGAAVSGPVRKPHSQLRSFPLTNLRTRQHQKVWEGAETEESAAFIFLKKLFCFFGSLTFISNDSK